MKKYYSGYICFSHEIIDNINLHARNFTFAFEDTINNQNIGSSKELIIYASNDSLAIELSSQIFAALVLIHSTNPIFIDEPLYPTEEENRAKAEIVTGSVIISMSGIFEATQIVIQCSRNNIYKNALLKYWLGCNLHSNEPIDLDPYHSEYVPLTKYRSIDHIRIGYAIVVFYSVLEELGLEIQASQKRPSVIHGQWNSEVKIDLENRLKAKRVNISDKILWSKRSTPTRIESRKRTLSAERTEWSRYNVRDIYIEIVDAIRIVSWMRSTIVSHKLDNSINSLSVYDVSNANNLSRIILLSIFRILT